LRVLNTTRAATVLLLFATPAWPQTRPLLTEQATTAGEGTLVLEVGADAIRGEPNFLTGGERDRLDLPVLRLVYSPASNVELDVEWVGRVIARDDPDFGSVSDFGDVSLRAKVRFAEGGDGRPAVGARFGVTLPQTSFGNGLGPNTLRFAAQLLVSQPLGGTILHLNAGPALQDEALRPHEQRDFLAYGVALERPLTDAFDVVAELAGLAGRGLPGADAHAEARAGVRYGRGSVRLDAAVRRGLAKADGTWGVTAGLTWRLRDGH
jgi:hypothetical protein